MTAIRMRDACFIDGSRPPVGPITLDLAAGAHVARFCNGAVEAAVCALLAAGIVKASSGTITIGEYDPRVQPVHCKRLIGYVPHDPSSVPPEAFERYIEYRAALWGIERSRARERATRALEILAGLHPAFAYPIAGALIAAPPAVIFDRPQAAFASQILAAAGASAVFSTHLDQASAAAFA